ncbi:MAG: metal ABC transporter permease [Phycisphaerae bacterium]|nr:metal ABC transporter permease [Tepidisphaeraceae bacterium]
MFPLAARFNSTQNGLAEVRDAVARLFDSRIEGVDCVVWAAVLLGVTCGVLGCFIVLRKQSLLGDAIGHSVLPGVCLGFIVAGSRSTPALLIGALIAGLCATALIGLLQRTTRLKPGECMGVVFTGFYGLGIVLLRVAGDRGGGGSAGLDRFLFGQIAGISLADVGYVAVVTVATLLMVWACWRSLAVWTFDEGFAHGIGVRTRALEYTLTGLLTLAIVISIQAVGVVLVAALLVTPAATAYLLTDRLHRMVILAAAFGAGAGVIGIFASLGLSSATATMPTGATIVLAAGMLFALAFLLSPRHGLLPRTARLWERRRRTRAENLLKTMYQIMERRGGTDRRVGVSDITSARQESAAHVRSLARLARKRDWLTAADHDPLVLTESGYAHAAGVVRNHRLWELFLTQEAHLAADHVHRDAEHIEHVLPRDVIARLEQMLDHPAADPHGRAIPKPAGGAV